MAGRGIIEIVNGKGAVVKPLDNQLLQMFFRRAMQLEPEAIIDLMELRGIEVRAAALAAQRRTADELDQLAEIVATMRRELHQPEAYVEADLAFHRQIGSMTHNTMLCYLLVAIRQAIKDILHESLLREQAVEQLSEFSRGTKRSWPRWNRAMPSWLSVPWPPTSTTWSCRCSTALPEPMGLPIPASPDRS